MGVLDVEWNFVLNSALINLLIGAVLNRLNDPPANRPSASTTAPPEKPIAGAGERALSALTREATLVTAAPPD